MDELITKLSQLFDKGFDINEELKGSQLSTNDIKFQNKVNEGIKLLEESTNLVNELSLFSSNESVEEIHTKNLKYLLLPAILADLTLKLVFTERSEVLETSQIYFNDFIQRLNDYKITEIEVKRNDSSEEVVLSSSSMATLESAVYHRNDKIKRYRVGKEMDNKLKQLRQQMSQTDDNTDDEIIRDYYLTLINRWINHSLEELNSIETEKPILDHMKQMKALNKDYKQKLKKSDTPRLKPMIITRNEVQKKVYGLGYPSIPTVSIDDFVNQKLEEGTLSITDPNIYSNNLIDWAQNPDKKLFEDECEEQRKEDLIERDDSENLRKAREWDDWKDDHKRGEGNRKNMG